MKLAAAVFASALAAGAPAAAQAPARAAAQERAVTRAPFGTTPEGIAVDRYTLTNASGVEMRVITFGADGLRQLFYLREAMEGMAARLAAENVSDQDLAELEQMLKRATVLARV